MTDTPTPTEAQKAAEAATAPPEKPRPARLTRQQKRHNKLAKKARAQMKEWQAHLKTVTSRNGERAVRKLAQEELGITSGRQWRKMRKAMRRRAKQTQPFKAESVKLAEKLFQAGNPVYSPVEQPTADINLPAPPSDHL